MVRLRSSISEPDARVFRFDPVGLDLFDRRPGQPRPGERVRKVQPSGCPRNGTAGHAYVEEVETGRFCGLVLVASLVPEVEPC